MIKKVFITGGGGFLGKKICAQLIDNNLQCTSFSRKYYPELKKIGVSSKKGDIRSFSDILNSIDEDCDAIIHTASQAGVWGDPKELFDINVIGSKNIIKAALKKNVKYLIYTSSPSVVFDSRNISNKDETLTYAKKHFCEYSKTKKLAEESILKANGKNGLLTSALRPHLIWGPEDPHFIPRLIQKVKDKKLHIIGGGKNLVDVIYVDNAAKAHLKLLKKLSSSKIPGGKAYFIGQENPVNLWAFINSMLENLGYSPCKTKVPFPLAYFLGFILEKFYKLFGVYNKEPQMTRFLAMQLAKSHYFNHSAAQEDFNYKAEITTKEGLKRLKEYYIKHPQF